MRRLGAARRVFLVLSCAQLAAWNARAEESVTTILADFESDTVAVSIGEVRNTLPADCTVKRTQLPARGQRSLAIEIGATNPNAFVCCELILRVPVRFAQAQRVAAFCQIDDGEAAISFRLRDGAGALWETRTYPITERRRWVRITAELDASAGLVRLDAQDTTASASGLQPPLEVTALCVTTPRAGRQVVCVDDLEVEQRVPAEELLRGDFLFDEPTHLYVPGATVAGNLELENQSRQQRVDVSAELSWIAPDGSQVARQAQNVSLPASGRDFRSRQPVAFSQRFTQPGLYRLRALLRSGRWKGGVPLETTVLVMPSNRSLPRGRDVFFGLRADLLREPARDQALEIRVAHEIGAQLLVIDTPWRRLEGRGGTLDAAMLDPILEAAATRDIAVMLALTDPPDGLDDATAQQRQIAFLGKLARHYGGRVAGYLPYVAAPLAEDPDGLEQFLAEVRAGFADAVPAARVTAPPVPVPLPAGRPPIPAHPPEGVSWSFETKGPSENALRALGALAAGSQRSWQKTDWWFHRAVGVLDFGQPQNGVSLLRHYVRAAEAGVSGLVWSDLRDNGNDPRRPEQFAGLTTRDFSPRETLRAFSTTVGMLAGTRYSGPIAGAPEAFESALFLASDRQVGVLIPRPNRIRPAVLQIVQRAAGALQYLDIERREIPLRESLATHPLATTAGNPRFVALRLDTIQAEPRLELTAPWLRVPAVAFCTSQAPLVVELQPPVALTSSYVRLAAVPDAPYDVPGNAQPVRARSGEVVRVEFPVTPVEGRDFEHAALTLRLGLEGQTLEIPLEVRPLGELRPAAATADLKDARYRLGRLRQRDPRGAAAEPEVELWGAYDSAGLTLLVGPLAGLGPSDDVMVGAAVEGADGHFEGALRGLSEGLVSRVLAGDGTWTAEAASVAGKADALRVRIPAATLGVDRLKPGARILVGVRLVWKRADGNGDSIWGEGVGTGSTEGFRWLTLTP